MPTRWQNTLPKPKWNRLFLNYQIRIKIVPTFQVSYIFKHREEHSTAVAALQMRYDTVYSLHWNSLVGEIKGEDTRCTQSQITLIFHVRRFVSVPNTTENISAEGPWPSYKLKCHLSNSKGQFRLELVVPYQSAVVFTVLVGQVCNGGRNAGAEELLPLVKVALMDFIKELMVSAHINRGSSELIQARGLSRKDLQRRDYSCYFLFSGCMHRLTLESSLPAALSVQSVTERNKK